MNPSEKKTYEYQCRIIREQDEKIEGLEGLNERLIEQLSIANGDLVQARQKITNLIKSADKMIAERNQIIRELEIENTVFLRNMDTLDKELSCYREPVAVFEIEKGNKCGECRFQNSHPINSDPTMDREGCDLSCFWDDDLDLDGPFILKNKQCLKHSEHSGLEVLVIRKEAEQ